MTTMFLKNILELPVSRLSPILRNTISIVDSVHRFSAVPSFPVVITRRRGENGAYIYRTRPSRPEAIEISAHGDHIQLTLLHELGHLLDHMTLNPIKRGFASQFDSTFDPLIRWWAEDRLVNDLSEMLRRYGRMETSWACRRLREELDPMELWARTYAQWVTVRSGDQELAQKLGELRLKGEYFAGRWCTLHWEEAEFGGIIPMVDRLMEEAGLR